MAVNTRLKIKLLESGRSQIEVATDLGMSESKFSKIINGWLEIDLFLKGMIAQELSCEVKDIF